MKPFSARAVEAAYDAVAEDYERAFGNDLDRLPLDRAMLDRVAAVVPGEGEAVLDLGCGPGPVVAYLAAKGVRAIGADISAAMLGIASGRSPRCPFVRADMRRLPFRQGAFRAVIAYYSIQHVSRAEAGRVLGGLKRVLVRNGVLLIATHLGEGDVFTDEFLGHRIAEVGGALYSRQEILDLLEAVGFTIEEESERDPLPHEHDTRRIYLLARKLRL